MGKWVSLGELGEKVAGDANGVAYGQREANDPYTHRTRTRTFPHAACNARAAITLHPRNHAVIASQPQISLTPHRCPPLPPRPPPSSDAPELASELVSELVVSELESSEEEDDEDVFCITDFFFLVTKICSGDVSLFSAEGEGDLDLDDDLDLEPLLNISAAFWRYLSTIDGDLCGGALEGFSSSDELSLLSLDELVSSSSSELSLSELLSLSLL